VLRFILRRVMYGLITLWLIITVTFVLMHNLPGDPFAGSEKLNEQQRAALFKNYGLDQPIWVQYGSYLKKVAQGDLGISFFYPTREVTQIIKDAFPVSAELGVYALVTGILFGLTLGILAALNHNKGMDYFAMLLAIVGVAVPAFVIGPLISFYVGVEMKLLPPALWKGWEYKILPTVTLSFGMIATMARMMRTSMLDVVNQDYIKTAKSKGLSQFAIVLKHQIRNAILPIITILGPMFINVITGTLVVEQIFAIPGLGKHFVGSITQNDYTIIMGLTIFYSAMLILMLIITDIMYGLVDPRIRLAKGGK
jgi:oligopeptide transport system permease protein